MSLEEELAKRLTLSKADLDKKAQGLESVEHAGEVLAFLNNEVYGPLLAAQRDAILRLAREVDELRASADKD
jgi:hypothetical protein